MASNCYANPNPIFQPAMRLISAISNTYPAIVETTFAHQYETLLIVRFDIPVACGMQQINKQTATITVLSSTTFSVDIDTRKYDIFAIPADPPPTIQVCAMVVPIGESSDTIELATRNILNPVDVR